MRDEVEFKSYYLILKEVGMRKALLFLVGALMVVMFAAESYAETTVGGTIDVRGRWRENNNDVNKDYYGSTAYWEEKVNLWVDAKVAEGLKGYVELQSDGSKGWQSWGTSRTTGTSAPNSFLMENQSYGAMEIRYAYIDFMIPSTPVGIKIGHFPIKLGHSIWADTNIWGSDGLLIYAAPIKELMIGLGTLKGYETASNTDRTDADLYVLMANYTFMPKNTVGFNASYIYRTGAGAETGVGKTVANAYWSVNSANGTAFNAVNNVKFWNIMLTVDGALDFGLGYKFEVDKQFGKLDAGVTGVNDLSASGLAFLLGADFKIADIAKVGLDVAYGSGDKCATWASEADGGACSTTGTKYEGYMSFNDYTYTLVYEDIVPQKRGVSTLANTDAGLYNTMYAKVGAGVTPMKDMSVGLDIYYLRAVKERYYNQKKNIGYEADLSFGYNIYKNLKWTFKAGYLLAGKHYKAINTLDRIDDGSAWALEQRLGLTF